MLKPNLPTGTPVRMTCSYPGYPGFMPAIPVGTIGRVVVDTSWNLTSDLPRSYWVHFEHLAPPWDHLMVSDTQLEPID